MITDQSQISFDMNRKKAHKIVNTLFDRLAEKYDMKKHEVMELNMKSCVDVENDMKPFVAVECTVVNKKTMDSYLVTTDIV